MGLGQLKKVSAKRVIGIDASTNSLAYAVFENGEPVTCGEVFFKGSTVYERLNDARQKTQALVDLGVLVGDYVGMESAIMVNNRQVVIKLSYIYGAILSVLMQNKMQVETVPPITWQSYIGNPVLKAAEKNKIKAEYPDKSASWYKEKSREIRKQRSLDFAKQYFKVESNSDNVGDAIGIAYYTSKVLTK